MASRIYHEQLLYSDGLACRLAYEALENEDFQKVWKLDRMLMVQNLPRETREGTQRMGERMLNLVESLYEIPILSPYRKRIKKSNHLVTQRLFLQWLLTILAFQINNRSIIICILPSPVLYKMR